MWWYQESPTQITKVLNKLESLQLQLTLLQLEVNKVTATDAFQSKSEFHDIALEDEPLLKTYRKVDLTMIPAAYHPSSYSLHQRHQW
jgi:hypothetical protein